MLLLSAPRVRGPSLWTVPLPIRRPPLRHTPSLHILGRAHPAPLILLGSTPLAITWRTGLLSVIRTPLRLRGGVHLLLVVLLLVLRGGVGVLLQGGRVGRHRVRLRPPETVGAHLRALGGVVLGHVRRRRAPRGVTDGLHLLRGGRGDDGRGPGEECLGGLLFELSVLLAEGEAVAPEVGAAVAARGLLQAPEFGPVRNCFRWDTNTVSCY